MQQSDAIQMLSVPGGFENTRQLWVELGCGTGTFTLALAHHLPPDSRIIAVDRDGSSLNGIPGHSNNVTIEKKHADFLKVDFPPESLNGILMANSLHYVEEQLTFIKTVKQFLKPDGCFLIVEYDTDVPNPWIPYPVGFNRLQEVFEAAGLSSVKKINEQSSRYNRSNLYSAIIDWGSSKFKP